MLIFCLLLGIYLLVFNGMGVTDDEQLFAVASGSLASGRNISILPLFGNDRLLGKSGNLEPLHILFNIPFFLMAKSFGLGRAQTQHLPAGIYTALSAALLAAIALRRGYRKSGALVFALIFGLGTIAFPYARTNFREPLAMLCLTGAAFCLDLLREAGQSFFRYLLFLMAMMVLVGLSALTKVTCGLCLPFFMLAGWLTLKRNAGCANKQIMFLFGTCLLIGLAGVAAALQWLPAAATRRFSLDFVASMFITMTRIPHTSFWQALAGMLLSPGKGLLFYSPVIVFGLIPKRWLGLSAAKPPFGKPASFSTPDNLIAFGSLAVLMFMQALIYDADWWGITWSTRALLPALPLLMLAALPALDAGLYNEGKVIRMLAWSLIAASLLIQVGRILTSDPVYANWVVQSSGQNLNTAQQWSMNLMPLWRHWQLAFQGVESDIAWLHLLGAGRFWAPWLVMAILAVIAACGILLFRRKSVPPVFVGIILFSMLVLLPAGLAVARYDERYHGENENYRKACEWIAGNAEPDSLLLVDAYLKPLWWYAFNFGCGEREWLGLPYEHAKPLSGALYYPRLRELAVWLKDQQAGRGGIYLCLMEGYHPNSIIYSSELEKLGLIIGGKEDFSNQPSEAVSIYKITF
jgi:4-amino-4-deoxy-L-arabinose transferase and related glycosyltransferases of PMT family